MFINLNIVKPELFEYAFNNLKSTFSYFKFNWLVIFTEKRIQTKKQKICQHLYR